MSQKSTCVTNDTVCYSRWGGREGGERGRGERQVREREERRGKSGGGQREDISSIIFMMQEQIVDIQLVKVIKSRLKFLRFLEFLKFLSVMWSKVIDCNIIS